MNEVTLNQGYLLATHMACCDGQLHQSELSALGALHDELAVDEHTTAAAEQILTQADEHLRLNEVIARVPNGARDQAVVLAATAAYADAFLDRKEEQLLARLRDAWSISEGRFAGLIEQAQKRVQLIKASADYGQGNSLSSGARTLAQCEAVLGKKVVDGLLTAFATEGMRERVKGFRIEQLLAGPQYDKAIEACRTVAEEDIVVVEESLAAVSKALAGIRASLDKNIQAMEEKIGRKPAPAARAALAELVDDRELVSRMASEDVQNLSDLLRKKRRSLGHYTIAFMGRSKAGKSTLHAVLTGGGWDQIGIGKQNTTRLNRVYEWHNIRIIDTPGIATPGGEALEEIAAGIVDEADLICFVMTDNNQQSSELSFLKTLREKGKPLLVLLNVRQDLTSPARLKRFLNNPSSAFSMEKDKLGGHIDRIRRDASEHYGTSIFPIVPVQLLAAQLAQQNDHPDAAALMRSSQLQCFLDQIRMSLLKQGELRRSQNLLASTVADISRIRDRLLERAELYARKAKHMAEAFGQKCEPQMNDAQKVRRTEMQTSIKKKIADFRSSVMSFATEHWEDSEKELNEAWKRRLLYGGIAEAVQKAQEAAQVAFSEDIKELMAEVGQELTMIDQIRIREHAHALKEQDSSRWMHNSTKWGGLLLGLAGGVLALIGSPFALPVGLAAAAVSLLSMLFGSKEEKKKKAVSALVSSLNAQLDKLSEEMVTKATTEFDKQCHAVATELRDYFEATADRMVTVSASLKKAALRLSAQIEEMNHRFAVRVLAKVTSPSARLTDQSIRDRIVRVEREVGKSMHIHLRGRLPLSKGWEEVSEVIQEQVNLHVTEG